MRPVYNNKPDSALSRGRLRFFYILIFAAFMAVGVKAFYLQVIKHDYYQKQAIASQFKQYEIPAERGNIYAYDGDRRVPLVLNQTTYTLFADPHFINDTERAAERIDAAIGGNTGEYNEAMQVNTRYSVLKKRLNREQKQKILDLDIEGIGLKEEPIRTYPQGRLAAQILGFVNDEGEGNYGIEQFLDERLSGEDGELKSVTDALGVPLASVGDNVRREPVPGQDVTLTIDVGLQDRLKRSLKEHLESVNSPSGSVIVADPSNGSIKAMANWPTYDPSRFYRQDDAAIFTNPSVSEPMEVGSIMKTLTVAAGLNEDVIEKDGTFYDPARLELDNETITNVEESGGPGTRSVADILRLSLNTGAVYVLQQMGAGEVNSQARNIWHKYLTQHYKFGQKTGVEQGYEAEGFVPDPDEGGGLNIQYANSTFGQGISVTPLQMLAAYSATINGGTYCRPNLVQIGQDGKCLDIIRENVVKPGVSAAMRQFHENSAERQYSFVTRDDYRIGGKTGTAEIPLPGGGYDTDVYNGMFIGYIGGDSPDYAIIVRINEPRVGGYAGTTAAAPMFAKTVDILINHYSIRPAAR